MDKLTRDELVLLAIKLDLPDILSFCNSSKYFNEKICKNEDFWRRKIEYERPGLTEFLNNDEESYKSIYEGLEWGIKHRIYSVKLGYNPLRVLVAIKENIESKGFISLYGKAHYEIGDKLWILYSTQKPFNSLVSDDRYDLLEMIYPYSFKQNHFYADYFHVKTELRHKEKVSAGGEDYIIQQIILR